MENLSENLSSLNMDTRKRNFVDDFLEKESTEQSVSKKSTRLELARAKNRQERHKQNLLKCKERLSDMMNKFREHQAAYDASTDDVERLKKLLNEEV